MTNIIGGAKSFEPYKQGQHIAMNSTLYIVKFTQELGAETISSGLTLRLATVALNI